jgi:hypothetical protein
LINEETANVLATASKHISRWAKQGDKPDDEVTHASKRASENAWRTTSKLITFLEHAKESDLYWKLLDLATLHKKSISEQRRLHAIAKQEDHQYMTAKGVLEAEIAKSVDTEKADPRAVADKLKSEQLKVHTIAGNLRNAQDKKIAFAARKATTKEQKLAVQQSYDAASAAFKATTEAAEAELDAALKKLGLLTAPKEQKKKQPSKTTIQTRPATVATKKVAAKKSSK